VTIVARNGSLVGNSPTISGIPDGIAFHAVSPRFVVTNNNDGTMTRLDFLGDDYTKAPTVTTFASGGFRGDLTQVGPDGCNYVTQRGVKFDDGTSSGGNSIVRICGDFAPPPGVARGVIFETVFRRCNTLHVGYNRFKDGTIVSWNVSTNGVGIVASGKFTAIGGGKLGSKTYHFLEIPLGTTLPSEASGIQSHMHFHWANGGSYSATRNSGC
jgi:hypothetical protein